MDSMRFDRQGRRLPKAIKILNDAEADLKDGNEAFCLDEVAAARKTLGLK